MLYFNRVEISEGIDVNKTSASKECVVCCCWYFLDKGFKFHLIFNLQKLSYCINDVYEPWRYCYSNHSRC